MKIGTYIFVHDQSIVLDYIEKDKFNGIENFKYVFLGSGETSLISNLSNVIICRDLPINIEQYPQLTSFSGWYALWKNNLIDEEYINLFEYDIIIENFLEIENLIKLNDNIEIIGYIPLDINHVSYIGNKIWISEVEKLIKEYYNIDIHDVVVKNKNYKTISMTSNHTFKFTTFDKYMIWVDPLINSIKNSKFAGHEIERTISLFYLIYNIKDVLIINDVLYHFQLDSHHTQNFPNTRFQDNYNNLINNNNNNNNV